LKKHKPWFDEGCSKLLDQRKQDKLQWLQDLSEINGDNLNNVRREASRYFRYKKREYLKNKIKELATNSKNKNIRDLYRGINEFKRGYQPRTSLVKHDNGNLLEDSHNILNRWRNYFSQLLNVHNVSDVRQIEVHTAEPIVAGPSGLEVQIAIAKLKKYKSPGSDQIPAELIVAGAKYYCLSSTYLFILFVIRKNCPISGRSLLLHQFTKKVIKVSVIIIIGYHCYQLHTKCYRIFSS
jgi:hypothetical protein